MKRSLVLMTLMIFWVNSAFAKSVTIQKGEVATFSGHLITSDVAEEAAKNKLKVIKLEDLRIAQDELIKYHESQSKGYRKKLSEAKFEAFTHVLGAFVLGVLVTGFAAKMNQKIGDL